MRQTLLNCVLFAVLLVIQTNFIQNMKLFSHYLSVFNMHIFLAVCMRSYAEMYLR
jgi:hypothetical protein